jgi:UDP-2,3-diacylglucosamine pyrophosphatase LpxH
MQRTSQDNVSSRLNRRAFIYRSSLFLAGAGVFCHAGYLQAAEIENAEPKLRIGMITDLHYADKNPSSNKYYRETLKKFGEAAKQFEKDKADFFIELGDLIDNADSVELDKEYLKRIAREFAATGGKYYFVLGNHCVWNLTKPEFLEIVDRKDAFYSFDAADCHFVVLDACFRNDGVPYSRKNSKWTDANIPAAQSEWLRADLQKTSHECIVFVHQRLDVDDDYAVKNAADIRRIFEQSGKVKAVFQGHYHRNAYKEIGGIHYCTLAAMVDGTGEEQNAYSLLEIFPGNVLRVKGFRQQKGYEWGASG